MDVLSEVLKVVKLQGALFYNGEFSSPWSFYSPPSRTVAAYVAPDARHVIVYHLPDRRSRLSPVGGWRAHHA